MKVLEYLLREVRLLKVRLLKVRLLKVRLLKARLPRTTRHRDKLDDMSNSAPLSRRPRGSGDEWVYGPEGQKYWGKFGAAGLLVHHPERGVLLQLRAEWSHFGGTWGLPGGGRHENETGVAAAIREAGEEAGVPPALLRIESETILDLGFWSYTTVVARAIEPFEPVIGDAESAALDWFSLDAVSELALHPGFAASWPGLRAQLKRSEGS